MLRDQGPSAASPVTDAEVDTVFAPFAELIAQGVVLAVSGGSDSIALMHLFTRWRDRCELSKPQVRVATIDHALRAGSADDAAFVLASAQALGLAASSRRWEGPKPTSGLAEAAREARYGLLAEVMQETGARVLMTAHTADDQAETVLMRLARGSGVDGLAGMAPVRPFEDGRLLLRPLLALEKARIEADLRARGIAWRVDPTNSDPGYERPRLRAARDALHALGLTPASLGLAARRARRASEALEQGARDAMTSPGIRIDRLGLVQVELAALLGHPDEIALRVLARAIAIAGGAAAPVSLASLEDVLADLRGKTNSAWTLARAALHVKSGTLLVEREPGRQPLPRQPLVPDTHGIWDGRFDVTAGACPAELEIGPLGAEGLAALEAKGLRRPKLPARTLRAIPAVWRGDELIAAPLIGYAAAQAMQLDLRMTLRGAPPTPPATQAEAAS